MSARCDCGKLLFRSREEAALTAYRLRLDGQGDLYPYWSKDCGYWHLTSEPVTTADEHGVRS